MEKDQPPASLFILLIEKKKKTQHTFLNSQVGMWSSELGH